MRRAWGQRRFSTCAGILGPSCFQGLLLLHLTKLRFQRGNLAFSTSRWSDVRVRSMAQTHPFGFAGVFMRDRVVVLFSVGRNRDDKEKSGA